MLSTTHIKIQIDQLYPIIHFCSGGSIVTKHKWPSSCLMSMTIISAICQGFQKHLIWTQHQAAMDSSQRHCLLPTNRLYWHSLYSLFAALSLAVCPLKKKSKNLSHLCHSFNPPPSTHPTPSFLFRPQPPTHIQFTWLCRARVGESVTMETGAEAVESSLWERGGKRDEEEKTKNWAVLWNPQAVIWCRSDSQKKGR